MNILYIQRYGIVYILITILAMSCEHPVIEESDDRGIVSHVERREPLPCKETFIFFTDPHVSYDMPVFNYLFVMINKYYMYSKSDFCMCGGDWLNEHDTKSQARVKLSKVKEYTDYFWGDDYYPILGNHDTNYLGTDDKSVEDACREFSHDELHELLFSRFDNTYYSFKNKSTRFYVMDSGIDGYPEMCDFKWEQLEWLAKELLRQNDEHVIINVHIYKHHGVVQPFAENLMLLAESFNERRTVSINDKVYDYSSSRGLIACFFCGHNHVDYVDTMTSIPVVCTANLRNNELSFDVCQLDWQKNQLSMYRVRSGNCRVVELAGCSSGMR